MELGDIIFKISKELIHHIVVFKGLVDLEIGMFKKYFGVRVAEIAGTDGRKIAQLLRRMKRTEIENLATLFSRLGAIRCLAMEGTKTWESEIVHHATKWAWDTVRGELLEKKAVQKATLSLQELLTSKTLRSQIRAEYAKYKEKSTYKVRQKTRYTQMLKNQLSGKTFIISKTLDDIITVILKGSLYAQLVVIGIDIKMTSVFISLNNKHDEVIHRSNPPVRSADTNRSRSHQHQAR